MYYKIMFDLLIVLWYTFTKGCTGEMYGDSCDH